MNNVTTKILTIFSIAFLITTSFLGITKLVQANPGVTTIFSDGFESAFAPWTGTGGTPVQSGVQKNGGSYSMVCDAWGDHAYKIFDEQTEVILTVFIWISAYPPNSGNVRFLSIYDSNGRIADAFLRKTAGGNNYVRLKRYYPTEVNDDWTGDVGTSAWINMTIKYVKHASSGGYWLWVDETLRCDMTSLDTSSSGNPNKVGVGTLSLSYTLTSYFDTVKVSSTEDEPPDGEDYTQIGWNASGVDVSDTGWKTCGSYFDEHHINLIKESNGTTVRIYVCREAWENEYSNNIRGLPYSDYILYLVQKCHQYGLRVWLTWQPAFDEDTAWTEGGGTSVSAFPWELKRAIFQNDNGIVNLWGITIPTRLGDSWRNWLVEVLTKCPADITDTICETTSTVSDADYLAFTTSTIDAIRSVDPDIFVWCYGKGGIQVWHDHRLGQLTQYENVGYNFHLYYTPSGTPNAWETQFLDGNYEAGKTLLWAYLDARLQPLMPNVWIGEFGGYRRTTGDDHYVNWDIAIQAWYNYCITYDIGCSQYAFGKHTYPMLDLATHSELNDVGQLWASVMPSPTLDQAAPTYSDQWYNATEANTVCEFSCNPKDETALSKGIFGTNNTGSWIYDSPVSLSGKSDWCNVTKTLNDTVGNTIGFKYQFNDTSDNSITTDIVYLTTSGVGLDTTPPIYSDVSHNETYIGKPCLFTIKWQDETALNVSIHSTNNTGTWVNTTYALPSNPAWHNVTGTLNDTEGMRIEYKYYGNDTSNNWRTSSTYFVVTEGQNESKGELEFFSTSTLKNANDLLKSSGQPYFSDCDSTITTFNYNSIDCLTFTVSASSGIMSHTWIYAALQGRPHNIVNAASWDYDLVRNTITIRALHHSDEDIEVWWSTTAGGVEGDEDLMGRPSFLSTHWLTIIFLVGIILVTYLFFGRGQ